MARKIGWIALCTVMGLITVTKPAAAQTDVEARGSRNMAVAGHVAVEGGTGAIESEQDPARPFVYLSKRAGPGGFVVISLTDAANPKVIHTWNVGQPTTDQESAGRDLVYFKHLDRAYLVQAFQFNDTHTNASLGAIVFDVTGLPDASAITEVARIQADGGFHDLFAYKHSDGRALLFATGGGTAHVYDIEQLLNGAAGLVAQIDTPEQVSSPSSGYHNLFVGYEPNTGQDRFYGAGEGGYYVFDITDPTTATMLTSISSAAITRGHAIAPSPDGRFAVTAAGYRTAPLRIYDLQSGLDGTIPRVRTAVGAWTADWRNDYAKIEVRWPYVFVAAFDGGLQVFNMRDPVNPYTTAFYRTGDTDAGTANPMTPSHGTVDVDIRNADGLIVVSDMDNGFWAFTLEAFEGWEGQSWGLPNMSSVQDWANGPDGR